MNHRSRPDIPAQWWSSLHLPLRANSQTVAHPVILDPRASLSSPPESPSPTFPSPTFGSKGNRSEQPPSDGLEEIEDEEYATRPYNPYNLPPASVIAVEVGSQSLSHHSLSRISERAGLDNPVIPDDDDEYGLDESQAITISTFFSPDLDARLPRTPDSDDNFGGRGRPVAQKRIASRGGGGAVRSTTRTSRVSPMTTPTKSRFSKDTRERESHGTSFACVGAKAVTKRRNLASLLGIKDKSANKGAPKAIATTNENTMDLDIDGGLDSHHRRLKGLGWGEGSDIGSWDENFFAAGGGREDRGSGEDGQGQWAEYLQVVGDTMTIASMDFVKPRVAPLPPNPSLPTIPTIPSLSPLPFDHAQATSVVTSTPRTGERARKRSKREGRVLSTGFPSPPMEIHTIPTTTFGLGLEGIEMELAMAMDTDFMDIDNRRDVDALDADGDVNMDQMTDVTPTTTTKTTLTNRKTKDGNQNLQPMAMDAQRQQQPTPADTIIRLPPTSLALKTPFGRSSRPARPTASNNNLSGTTAITKPLPLPRERQLLLTRTVNPRTPLSASKPPAQKLMGKTMLSLPSVSASITPRPTPWNEPSPVTPVEQLLSPLSPSPTPSPRETPCPPERPPPANKPFQQHAQVYQKRASTMDEVRMCAQIDQCITATDGMEEVSIPPAVILVPALTLPCCRLCAPAAISTRRHSRPYVAC